MKKRVNSREAMVKLKPKQITTTPMVTFNLSNKEDLRDIITDHVLHNIDLEDKPGKGKAFKSKRIKYPTIPLTVNINHQERQLNFDFVMILNKYMEFQKKNIYRQERIEPVVVDILNFIDQMEEKANGIIFAIDAENMKKPEEEVLSLIIQKHHKDKQKKNAFDIEEIKTKVIAKHTRISFIDIEDKLKKKEKSFLLEINQLSKQSSPSSREENVLIPNSIHEFGKKLRDLIEEGQIFETPSKIEALKKEKIIQFYKSSEVEYLNFQTEIKENFNQTGRHQSSLESLPFLESWVNDISLSQKYYQLKFGKNQRKKVQSLNIQTDIFSENSNII